MGSKQVAMTCWSIWLHRNGFVFENKKLIFIAGYLYNLPPAPFVDYPLEVRVILI